MNAQTPTVSHHFIDQRPCEQTYKRYSECTMNNLAYGVAYK